MRTIGLIIEGVNAPRQTSYYDGIVWYYGELPPVMSTYLWIRDLTQVPQTISESVSPVSGQLSASVSGYQITRTTESALYLLGRQLRSTVALTANYLLGASQIKLNATGLTGLIWVDDECMQLSTESPSGTYNVTPAIGETANARHEINTLVFQKNPYLWRRRYRLVEYDWDTGTLRTIARGAVDRMVESMMGLIDITTVSLPALISGAMLNKGARKYQATIWTHNINGVPGGRVLGVVDAVTQIARNPSARTIAVQVGDTMALAQAINSTQSGFLGAGARNMPSMQLPPPEYEEVNGKFTLSVNDARELFVVSTVSFSSSSSGLNTDLADGWRHRLALAYGFLRAGRGQADGSYDRWSGSWGVGLRQTDFDHTGILASFDKISPDIDQLILGTDGDAVSVEDLITRILLQPAGFFLSTLEDGRIGFSELRVPTIEDFLAAPIVSAIEARLDTDWQIEEQVSGVTAEVGGTPWTDPDVITVDIRTGLRTDTARRAMYETDAQYPIDFQTYGRDRSNLLADLFDRLAIARRGPPIVGIRALPLTGDTYDLGRWYRMDIPVEDWWVIEGVETTASAFESLGYLIGRKYNIAEGTYDLDFITHAQDGRIARLRAPTGLVRTSATSTVVAVEVGHGLLPGDIVDLCASDGAVVVADSVIAFTSSNTVQLSVSTTHTVGQILRLAKLSDYTVTPRLYSFIAGTDELIEDLEAADIYG